MVGSDSVSRSEVRDDARDCFGWKLEEEVQFLQRIGPYDTHEIIGSGSYSDVKLVVDSRSGTPHAMKRLRRHDVIRLDMKENVINEVTALKKVHENENIVSLLEVLQTGRSILLILELCSGGELFDRIIASRRLQESVAKQYFQQIVLAIAHCHARGIAHRDIKPENMLLDQNGRIKVTDFGLCSIHDLEDENPLVHDCCGTPNYMAPEATSGNSYNPFMADMWSLGVLLYVMVRGRLPFTASSDEELYKRIRRGVLPEGECVQMSPALRALIFHLLEVQVEHRMTMEELLQNPWCGINLLTSNPQALPSLRPKLHIQLPGTSMSPKLPESDGFGSPFLSNGYRASHAPTHKKTVGDAACLTTPLTTPAAKINVFDLFLPYLIMSVTAQHVPNTPVAIQVRTRALVNASSRTLYDRLKTVLHDIGFDTFPRQRRWWGCVRGLVGRTRAPSSENKIIEFSISIFDTVVPMMCLWEVRRLRGDASMFHHVYHNLSKELRDILPANLPYDPLSSSSSTIV